MGDGFSERIWYRSALQEENAILTPLFESLLTEKQIFTAAAPVFDGKGQVAGVVGLDINVDSWTKI
jgi:hypothetical protein